jgi:riboflavin biosynthesis pyrimidine reductase
MDAGRVLASLKMAHDLALTALLDATHGPELPLPPELRHLYGPMRLGAPSIFANFVSSLDGVVALGEPGTGGKQISGGNAHDRAVMGLLRAAADVVIVGAGTLRSVPRHVWTASAIYAPMAEPYARLRASLGQGDAPLTVIVTASGDLDPTLPVFGGGAPVTVVTTPAGARALAARGARGVDVRVVDRPGPLDAGDILGSLDISKDARILLECGPRLLDAFLAARRVDELFLTLAPQVAGRAPGTAREAFAAGTLFLPDRPLWAELVSVKNAGSLLFLRYRFAAK